MNFWAREGVGSLLGAESENRAKAEKKKKKKNEAGKERKKKREREHRPSVAGGGDCHRRLRERPDCVVVRPFWEI